MKLTSTITRIMLAVFASVLLTRPILAAESLIPIRVNVMPFLEAAPLLLGIKHDIFKKHGLDVSVGIASSGATIVPTVLSGEYDLGYSNAVSALQAIDKGFPLLLIHSTYSHPSDPAKEPYFVYVDPKGPIKEAAQLAHANIGVHSIKNIGEWSTLKALESIGVHDVALRWTRVTGEDAYDAVKSGQIDAVWLFEPLGAAAKAAGLVPLLPVFTKTPGTVSGYYIASQRIANEKPLALKQFNEALDEANDYAQQHPDEGRDAVIEKFNFKREYVYASNLNLYTNNPELGHLKEIASDLVRFNLISKQPDIEAIYWANR